MYGACLEAVSNIVRWHGSLPVTFCDRRLGRPVANDAAIDPAPRELAAQPAELDLRATVHDDLNSGFLCDRRCLVVADAELHPHDLGANCDRVFDDTRCLARRAKYVDHVDRLRNVAQ